MGECELQFKTLLKMARITPLLALAVSLCALGYVAAKKECAEYDNTCCSVNKAKCDKVVNNFLGQCYKKKFNDKCCMSCNEKKWASGRETGMKCEFNDKKKWCLQKKVDDCKDAKVYKQCCNLCEKYERPE